MTKLCLIDLDGVVANRDARLAKARDVYIEKMLDQGREPEPLTYKTGFDWDTLFDPRLVCLDTLIEGTGEALHDLETQGYDLYLLTSRPESMRQATLDWLYSQWVMIPFFSAYRLIMRQSAFQGVKTPAWKAGMVQMLALFMDAREVAFIDDREENIQAVLKHQDSERYTLKVYASLADAVRSAS